MKIGIISSDKEEWHVREIMVQLKKRGAEAYIFPVNSLVSRIDEQPRVSVRDYSVEDYDALIVRRVPGGSPEQVFYRMDVLHLLEDLGVYVINPPDAIECSVDKFYTSALLSKSGLKTPKTIVTENFSDAIKAFKDLGEDVIVKPIFGSLGLGITRVTDRDIAYRVFRALEMTRSVYYLQEFIQHGNKDIRAFVIGGKVVASMQRSADIWKTNISGGGTAHPYDASDKIKDISIKAAENIGLEYAGVDLLESINNGYTYVVELNSTPGWEGLQSVTEGNIASLLVDYLYSRIKR